MTYRQIEAGLQEAVVRYLRLTLPRCIVFAVPNGGKRGIKTAKLMKRTGALAGVFDLILLAPGGKTFFIEVKAGKGQLSDSQEVFKLAIIRMGHPYVVVRNLDDLQAALIQWGLYRESVHANRSLFQREQSGQDGQASPERVERMGIDAGAGTAKAAAAPKGFAASSSKGSKSGTV